MSGLNWFEWNGKKSTDYGVYVNEQPAITMPLERTTQVKVVGRPGTLTKIEGEDVYDDLVLTVTCVMKNAEKLPEIMGWLKGAGKVSFPIRKGGFYYARVANQIPFDKVMRGRENRSFAITFRCRPFWYVASETAQTLTKSGSVTNSGTVYSEPIITVTGTGDGRLIVGGEMIDLEGMTGSITIDSELMECYDGMTSMNDKMSGEFPRLRPGANGISWSGGITKVSVKKNTRYL